MKRMLTVLAALLAFMVLTGMGNLGGGAEGTIPETKENIRARIVDRTGTATELTRVSLEGKLVLEASRGSGKVLIPFSEIQSVAFGERSRDEIQADVRLKSGQDLRLTVRNRVVLFGDTGYGAFQIRLRDVKRIEFE